ncbi:MAG: ring-opening amidohydrolase [Actinomycetota bacterium]|nr:ring-opening amidohydrolase [Actinomycetota bacterium]
MSFAAHKVLLGGVSDASGLQDLISKGEIEANNVIAIVGKTEGNGGVNDYTRILADQAFRSTLLSAGTRSSTEIDQIPMAWSGGTDGVISPNAVVFSRDSVSLVDDGPSRMSVGISMSDPIKPEDIGRPEMVGAIARGVQSAMTQAGISDPGDVHFVQTKTPLLTMESISDATSRGKTVFTHEPLESMAISNGTAALGVAVALGEIEMPKPEQIGRDLGLYCSVASCSSGVELERGQIVVVGNAAGAGGRFRVGHSVMRDAIDSSAVYEAIRNAGVSLPNNPSPGDLQNQVVQVFAKAEANPGGLLRGYRQVMLNDSDVHHHRQIKAAVGGVIAAAVADPAIFVSVAALHQGPPGGGPKAAIVELPDG